MIDPEQLRTENNALLRSRGIQVNEFLPLLEEASLLQPLAPGAAEIARRCMVLNHLIGIGFGGHPTTLKAAVEKWDLWSEASGRERGILSCDSHDEQELIDAMWLVECVQSFAWCLGLAGLPHLEGCEADLASKFPPPLTDPAEFIARARLRPFEEIYREADYHYRLHWATRQARLTGQPFGRYEGLVMERRKALDWAIGAEADWDSVGDCT